MKIEKLDTPGVEISGVDLAGSITDNQFDAIRASFNEHGLVFFRGQQLSEQDHIAFARRFGDININRFFAANPEYPEIAMVTKEPDQEANIGGGWHTDHSYDPEPALGSILVARELPETGGDTWFVSMYQAFDNLSEGMVESLARLNAVHSTHHVFGTTGVYKTDTQTGDRIGNTSAADVMQDVVHPVIIRHPLSGRRALYVNPAFTVRFQDWTVEESAALLSYLYEQSVRDDQVTRFHWEPGSIAFWDNRATWHFAQNDYQGLRREMHRITIEGCALAPAAAS